MSFKWVVSSRCPHCALVKVETNYSGSEVFSGNTMRGCCQRVLFAVLGIHWEDDETKSLHFCLKQTRLEWRGLQRFLRREPHSLKYPLLTQQLTVYVSDQRLPLVEVTGCCCRGFKKVIPSFFYWRSLSLGGLSSATVLASSWEGGARFHFVLSNNHVWQVRLYSKDRASSTHTSLIFSLGFMFKNVFWFINVSEWYFVRIISSKWPLFLFHDRNICFSFIRLLLSLRSSGWFWRNGLFPLSRIYFKLSLNWAPKSL